MTKYSLIHLGSCPKLNSEARYADCAHTLAANARGSNTLLRESIVATFRYNSFPLCTCIQTDTFECKCLRKAGIRSYLSFVFTRLRTACAKSKEHLITTMAIRVFRAAFPRQVMEGLSSRVNLWLTKCWTVYSARRKLGSISW